MGWYQRRVHGGSAARLLTMKAFLTVLLAVAVSGEAEPYTIGQVLTGQTNGGIITGVGYGHGLNYGVVPSVYAHVPPPPVATIRHFGYGKREAEPWTVSQIAHGAHIANPAAEGRAPGVITNAAFAPVTHYSHHPYVYNPVVYGKREAEPYTVAQIAHGAHIANAAADGRLHNVGVITNAAIAPVTYAVPAVPHHAAVTYTHPSNVGICLNTYGLRVPC